MNDDPNPCEADRARRERAFRDSMLTERTGPMARSISFEAGYDHSGFGDACGEGSGGHGRHGMVLRFVLSGPAGAVQWCATLVNWYPGNVDIIGTVGSTSTFSAVPSNRLGDGMATDLGFHSPVRPAWDTDEWLPRRECHLLPEGYCYYDGSGLNAEPILAAFLEHGPHAVWAALAHFYRETFAAPEPAEPAP